MLKLADFDYHLPKDLVAQYPLREREKARLLVLDRAKATIQHCLFEDLLGYLNKDDLLLLNDTKVLPCRLKGRRRSGGSAELLLLNLKSGSTFHTLIRPGRIKIGEEIVFNGGGLFGRIGAKNEVTFNTEDLKVIYGLGAMPLPPYIKREPQELDAIYYQTVYARREGAVAAPTAGLHFTDALLKRIKAKAVAIGYLTLHVGCGTFLPVRSEDIRSHKMQPEYFEVPEETAGLLEKARGLNGRILAVGTTTVRAVESYSSTRKSGYTDLFIWPGYKFKAVDCLLTNFHLPRTTLFMLVCAFAGEALTRKAYQEAIAERYRFYSYGDAMLIL